MNSTPLTESTHAPEYWHADNTQSPSTQPNIHEIDECCRLQADFARRQAGQRPVPYSVAQAYRRMIEMRGQR